MIMKFHQLTSHERLAQLVDKHLIDENDATLLNASYSSIHEKMIENYIGNYAIPLGLLPKITVNGTDYVIPMATEEPSVIAAAANGARMFSYGTVTAQAINREMIGQVLMHDIEFVEFEQYVIKHESLLIALGNAAHPSMQKRGGGLKKITVRNLGDKMVSLDLLVDAQEAMGANTVNTMAEAIAVYLRDNGFSQQVDLAILSNLATQALVEVRVSLPFNAVEKVGFRNVEIAQKIAQANLYSHIDPYRATTENKGIMNGIDAVVMASGNDWRAIAAGAHAYASYDGKYTSLSKWQVIDDRLEGSLTIPLPVGIVGGSIGIVPLAKVNQKLLKVTTAKELACVIATVGLAQNLAALRALVTNGIQAGHMQLQLKSLALAVGAKPTEVTELVQRLAKMPLRNTETALKLLKEMRN
ncbi:hydroxymethylglutaryl-CoA reductase, degradative [Periweissella beninensis]|nr:hydroxymethylglutaryl-CoA reductase, degradative [Periweissella beninensis]